MRRLGTSKMIHTAQLGHTHSKGGDVFPYQKMDMYSPSKRGQHETPNSLFDCYLFIRDLVLCSP